MATGTDAQDCVEIHRRRIEWSGRRRTGHLPAVSPTVGCGRRGAPPARSGLQRSGRSAPVRWSPPVSTETNRADDHPFVTIPHPISSATADELAAAARAAVAGLVVTSNLTVERRDGRDVRAATDLDEQRRVPLAAVVDDRDRSTVDVVAEGAEHVRDHLLLTRALDQGPTSSVTSRAVRKFVALNSRFNGTLALLHVRRSSCPT